MCPMPVRSSLWSSSAPRGDSAFSANSSGCHHRQRGPHSRGRLLVGEVKEKEEARLEAPFLDLYLHQVPLLSYLYPHNLKTSLQQRQEAQTGALTCPKSVAELRWEPYYLHSPRPLSAHYPLPHQKPSSSTVVRQEVDEDARWWKGAVRCPRLRRPRSRARLSGL